MYTVLILAHTIDNSFNKENRIKHDLHLEVCHISKELDDVATCHHWWPCLPHWWVAVLLCCWSQMYAACVDNNFNSKNISTYMWWHWIKLLMLPHTSFLTLILPGAWLGTNIHLFQETARASAQKINMCVQFKIKLLPGVLLPHYIFHVYPGFGFLLSEQCTLS